MNASILCTLLAQRIPPEQFQLWGLEVHWVDEAFDTPGNRAIVEDVIANYDTLAAVYEARQAILKQIIELELLQTPRRVREAAIEPAWMYGIEAQIAALREVLRSNQ